MACRVIQRGEGNIPQRRVGHEHDRPRLRDRGLDGPDEIVVQQGRGGGPRFVNALVGEGRESFLDRSRRLTATSFSVTANETISLGRTEISTTANPLPARRRCRFAMVSEPPRDLSASANAPAVSS